MNIKPLVYESLTPAQRVIAAIEAIARKDEAELENLRNTCPRKHYTQEDFRYSGTLQYLLAHMMATENALSGHALSILMSLYVLPDCEDKAEALMQRMANDLAAWHDFLESMGIAPATMDKVAAVIRHPLVTEILKTLPEPEEGAKNPYMKGVRDFFAKIQST